MRRLILVCLTTVFAVSLASEAFAWGAVRGPGGGGAYRGPMGGEAVRGPAGNTAVRGPDGGAAAWGRRWGGVSAAGGGSVLRRCRSALLSRRRGRDGRGRRRGCRRRGGVGLSAARLLRTAGCGRSASLRLLSLSPLLLGSLLRQPIVEIGATWRTDFPATRTIRSVVAGP